jgi:RES domain
MRVTSPADDPERGIYYAAFDLEGAVVEVFGDPPRLVERGSFRVVRARLMMRLRMLDLRGRGAMLSGTSAGISGTENRALTQAWARYFYDRTDLYRSVDGLLYSNSHNQLDAVAIFERRERAIASSRQIVIPLRARRLEPELFSIAARNNLTVI